jgi:hypothetical protein
VYQQWCLEGLAGVAAAQGRCERAAEIDGAGEFLGITTGVMLPPVHPAGYARTLATVRAGLAPADFDAARAWAATAQLAPDKILAAVKGREADPVPGPAAGAVP